MPFILSAIFYAGTVLALSGSILLHADYALLRWELLVNLAALVAAVYFGYHRWQEYTSGIKEFLQVRKSLHMANEHMLKRLNEAQITEENLRTEATHDALTGLLNRRLLDENLEREVARAVRGNYPVSAIMLDVDHFKALNDRYGHLAGDEVLKGLSRIITAQARASDLAFRYGGEEFLIILPNMPEAAALQRAELWRSECEATAIETLGLHIQFTVSAGVSTFPTHAMDGLTLISTADRALYQAKHNGRNMVCLFPRDQH